MSEVQSLLFLLSLAIRSISCQDWTWLGGDKMADQLTSDNHPGGRSGSGTWHSDDTVWMFGVKGFTYLSAGTAQVLNDVWSFNITSNEFQLEHPGSRTLHAFPSSQMSAIPSGRQFAALCGEEDKLFVFGGFGNDGKALGDLWIYDTNKREWLNFPVPNVGNASLDESPAARGHSAVWCYNGSMYLFGGVNNEKTVFGDMWKLNLSTLEWSKLQKGSVSALTNSNEVKNPIYPPARNGAAVWISGHDFYMFGGNIDPEFLYTMQHATGLTSDLWQYSLSNNTWQFVTGETRPGQHSVYNEVRYSYHSNNPGCRIGAATWTDAKNDLWLFGGAGADVHSVSVYHSSKLLSDVWRFHVYTASWAFMGGSDKGEMGGRYGPQGETAETNLPGARTEMTSWPGRDNLAYIFGGLGHDGMYYDGHLNDLWSVDVSKIVKREYMITPMSMFVFLGVSITLLLAVAALAVCSRHGKSGNNNSIHIKNLQLKHRAEYSRLENVE